MIVPPFLRTLSHIFDFAAECAAKGVGEETAKGLSHGAARHIFEMVRGKRAAKRLREATEYCTSQNVANLLSNFYAPCGQADLPEVAVHVGNERLLTGVY